MLGDVRAAERSYERLLAAAAPPAARAEAWAGLVSCRQAAGDAVGAGTVLARWLAEDPPASVEAVLGLALGLDRAGAAVVDQLLVLWRLVHEEGRPCGGDLVFALDAVLNARASGFTPAQRAAWAGRSQALRAEQRALAWWTGLDAQDRQEAQTPGSPVRLAMDPEVVALMVVDEPRRRSAVVALHIAGLADRTAIALGGNATLAGLAHTLRGGGMDPPAVIEVVAPWGDAVRIDVPPPAAERWPGPRTLARLLLGGAVLAVLAGFAALLFAAHRDLRLARLKTDFVSNVSHELKTPISLIRLYGEMLTLGYAADEAQRSKAQAVIVAEAERLGLLIDNVLDFARIERGERTYRREPVDLAALIRRVAEAYRPQLDAGGFTLALELAEDLPPIGGDADALTQVLLNLMANACKFSTDDRRLAVTLARGADGLRWRISDHGIGIPAAEQARIFDPFYRVESGLTRSTRGAGIGLALVRHIVHGHGGTITVDSAPGSGTTFIITLPEVPCPTRPS